MFPIANIIVFIKSKLQVLNYWNVIDVTDIHHRISDCWVAYDFFLLLAEKSFIKLTGWKANWNLYLQFNWASASTLFPLTLINPSEHLLLNSKAFTHWASHAVEGYAERAKAVTSWKRKRILLEQWQNTGASQINRGRMIFSE